MGRVFVWVFACLVVLSRAGGAQACGGSYVVAPGDSLSLIAARHYQNAFVWVDIYASNRAVIGDDPDTILKGTQLSLPCLGEKPDPRPLARNAALMVPPPLVSAPPPSARDNSVSAGKPLRVLRMADFAPFSADDLPAGGLISELVVSALAAASPNLDIEVESAAWTVLNANAEAGLKLPLIKPDCPVDASAPLCAQMVWSDPMLEMLMIVFVDDSRPVSLADPADMHGRVLCRPDGMSVDFLDAEGRNWLKDHRVELKRPDATEECFSLLLRGEVDAVVLNEFTGRAMIAKLALQERVSGLYRSPLAIVTLHAASPRGEGAAELIASLDAGLATLRSNGEYRAILDKHLLATPVAGF